MPPRKRETERGYEEESPGFLPVCHGGQDEAPELEENHRRRQDETGNEGCLHVNHKDLRRPGKVKMARRCRKKGNEVLNEEKADHRTGQHGRQ